MEGTRANASRPVPGSRSRGSGKTPRRVSRPEPGTWNPEPLPPHGADAASGVPTAPVVFSSHASRITRHVFRLRRSRPRPPRARRPSVAGSGTMYATPSPTFWPSLNAPLRHVAVPQHAGSRLQHGKGRGRCPRPGGFRFRVPGSGFRGSEKTPPPVSARNLEPGTASSRRKSRTRRGDVLVTEIGPRIARARRFVGVAGPARARSRRRGRWSVVRPLRVWSAAFRP